MKSELLETYYIGDAVGLASEGSGVAAGGTWEAGRAGKGGHGGSKGPPGGGAAEVWGLGGAIAQRDRERVARAYIETILTPEPPKRYSPATDNPEHFQNPDYLRSKTINPGTPLPPVARNPDAGGRPQ